MTSKIEPALSALLVIWRISYPVTHARGCFLKFPVEPDPERSESRLVVERVQHGLTDRFVFGHQFFDGGDFAQIARAAGLLVGLMGSGAGVSRRKLLVF